ncbi:unnamed protein product [Linum tenue]|nr:unnamed protein product [Linum tenue]
MRIIEAIGKPVRVDRATKLGARGKFARVCVEADLTQPLLGKYKVEGVTYIIQYEGLESICTNCGSYGKSTEACQCTKQQDMVEEEGIAVGEEKPLDPTQGQSYGEWMVVKRRELWQTKRTGGGNSRESKGSGNRFHVLDGRNAGESLDEQDDRDEEKTYQTGEGQQSAHVDHADHARELKTSEKTTTQIDHPQASKKKGSDLGRNQKTGWSQEEVRKNTNNVGQKCTQQLRSK